MASAAEIQPGKYPATGEKGDIERRGSVAKTEKGRWERLWPVIACGAGLFSDGYLNNIIGPVNTMLKIIYGIAAAVGRIGAFAGSYALDALQKATGDDRVAAGRNPFFVASTLAFVAAGLVLLLPHIGQDTIDQEDVKFREYLTANGSDTSKMGLDSIDAAGAERDENGAVSVEQTYGK